MFEELNERRKAVERNIAKGFGIDDADLDFEKALEDELEKGRAKKNWNIGDTFTRHGITYKCTGISSNTGRPTWSKVKNEGSNTKENRSNEELDTSQKQERAKILEFYKKYKDFRNEIETNLGEVNVNEIPFKTLKEEFESWYEDAQYVIKKHQDQSDKKEDKKEKISQKEVIDFFEKNADKFLEFKNGDLEGTDLEKEFKKYSKFVKLGKTFDASEKEDWEVYKTNKELSGYRVVDAGEGTDAFVALLIKKQQDQQEKKEEEQKPKKLSELKRGDTVALIMERYNPQLGDYVTIKKVQIEGTTSKSFKVDYMKFDKETGERTDKSSSVYGSSKHYILLPEEVNTHIKDGKWKGDRISGGNPFEDE